MDEYNNRENTEQPQQNINSPEPALQHDEQYNQGNVSQDQSVFQPQPQPAMQNFQTQQPIQQNFQAASYQQAPVSQHEHLNPGLLVLQWLTYAFWGWLAIGLSVLTPITFANFFEKTYGEVYGVIYGIAAVIMLTIIASVLDFFFHKKEVEPKTGASAAVMVIHAVIFGLFNVGWMIALVFLIINTLIGDNDSGMVTFICTALVMIVFYALLLVRTLDFKQGKYKKPAIIACLSITGLIILLALVGPVAKSAVTKQDRLIESNLSSVTGVIEGFAEKNNKLPDSIKTIASTTTTASSDYYLEGANKLISKNLVEYTPNTKPKSGGIKADDLSMLGLPVSEDFNTRTTYYYKICVNYSHEKKDGYSEAKYNGDYIESSEMYSYTSNHPSGKSCYNIKYVDYNN